MGGWGSRVLNFLVKKTVMFIYNAYLTILSILFVQDFGQFSDMVLNCRGGWVWSAVSDQVLKKRCFFLGGGGTSLSQDMEKSECVRYMKEDGLCLT